jgi:hypothetical protein
MVTNGRDIPIRMAVAANAGGVGHFWVVKRYVFTGASWMPTFEPKSKRNWIHAPSTFADNNFIDKEPY